MDEMILFNEEKYKDSNIEYAKKDHPKFKFKFDTNIIQIRDDCQAILDAYVKPDYHNRAYIFGEFLLESTKKIRNFKEQAYILIKVPANETNATTDLNKLLCDGVYSKHLKKARLLNYEENDKSKILHYFEIKDELSKVKDDSEPLNISIVVVNNDQVAKWIAILEPIYPFCVCYYSNEFYYSNWYAKFENKRNLDFCQKVYGSDTFDRLLIKGFNAMNDVTYDGS